MHQEQTLGEAKSMNSENIPPFADRDVPVTPVNCLNKRIQAYRSAPLLSPMLDLSSSLLEAQRQLQRPDTIWSQVTPGGVRFTRRRLTDSSQHTNRNLMDMPNEVVDHVLSFLNKRDLMHVGATCKRFYLISSNPRHWNFVNLSGKSVFDSALHRLISRRTKSLALMTSNIDYDYALLTHEFPLCQLTKLDLSWAKFRYPSMLNSILRRCQDLQCLGLQCQCLDFEALDLISKNHHLSVLNISECGTLDPYGLRKIFANCRLTEFNASWCHFSLFSANVIINEIPSTITRLAIAGTGDLSCFGDEGWSKIIDRLPSIFELDVGDNHEITAVFITKLHNSAPNLKKLTVARCFKIEPIAYCMLDKLRVLNLFGNINDTGYRFLKAQMPHLIINQSPFQTVAKSQTHNCSKFWGECIDEPY
ncbi:hypothetical protein FO519_008780 [Halicephalobus sp. NKZ332]|nr:hypothetical protein FO519_008780 [Halicephalobus sp. NKZ332]